jgi:hypothetical protein
MANKFLSVGSNGSVNLSDGTTPIFASTLGSADFEPSKALKTNSGGVLVSADLAIGDIQSLDTSLTTKDDLSFIRGDTHSAPSQGRTKIYVKADGKLYKLPDEGAESTIGDSSDKLPLSGGVMTGELSFTDGAGISGLPAGTSNNDPVIVSQLASKVTGASSSTTLGVALYQDTTGKIIQDAGGSLTWDDDNFRLQVPTVEGKSGDLTLQSIGGGVLTVGDTTVTLPDNDLVMSDGDIKINGASGAVDINDTSSRAIIKASSSEYIDTVGGRSYNFTTSNDGIVHNLSNTNQSHEFQINGVTKLSANDGSVQVTEPFLVSDGTLSLEPRTFPAPTTVTSVEMFSNSADSDRLTYRDTGVSYPIAGQELITVKYSKRFAGNVAQTLYTDTNMEFLWDAINLQVQFKPLTYVSTYVDACNLFVPGSANNTVKDTSGDILFVNNSVYYFSNNGTVNTNFNMSSYGARQFLAVCPEVAITSESPCYRLDLMCGNTNTMNITIEKQSV